MLMFTNLLTIPPGHLPYIQSSGSRSRGSRERRQDGTVRSGRPVLRDALHAEVFLYAQIWPE